MPAALAAVRADKSIPFARVPASVERQDAAAFDGLLAELPTSFADAGAAEHWLESALRALVEGLDADRAEIFGVSAGDVFRLERSWPPSEAIARLALERSGELPWLGGRLHGGELVVVADVANLPEESDRAATERAGVRSFLAIPLRGVGELVAVLCVTSSRPARWSDRIAGRVHRVGQAIGAMMAFTSSRRALAELRSDCERLQARVEVDSPRPDAEATRGHREIVGRSAAICRILEKAEQVAPTRASVLLLGETGTGKELVASAIHEMSDRRGRPMVRVNCGALPASLVESELFGREKGAYTGALTRQAGRFEIANHSTILLDEVGDLPPEVQVKLLRVLQQGEFERIGSTTTQKVDVRVIAATNRDLAKDVRDGRFREDLFYRLNVFPIRIPALRDRREDIPLLVWAFADEFARSMGRTVERISCRTMEALQAYSWPGNVRELRNVIERAMILHHGSTLHIDPPESENAIAPQSRTLEDVERHHIHAILEATEWRIRGKNGAAEILGLKPTTLESRLEKLGIRRPDSARTPASIPLDARGH